HTDSGKPPQPDTNTTRIRSLTYVKVSKGNMVKLSDYENHKYIVFMYKSNNDNTFIEATGWLDGDFMADRNGYIKIVMAYADDKEISESEISSLANLLEITTN